VYVYACLCARAYVCVCVILGNDGGKQRSETFRDGEGGTPVILEYVQTNASVLIHIAVIHFCTKLRTRTKSTVEMGFKNAMREG
jgi:hypothetical protein